MLIADLHATRDDVFPDDGSIPAVAVTDERLYDRADGHGLGGRRGALPALVAALVFNALAVLAFVILWRGIAAGPPVIEDKPITTVANLPGELATPPKPPAPQKPKAAPTPPQPAPPGDKPADQKAADALRDALELPALPPSAPTPDPEPPKPPQAFEQHDAKDDKTSPPAMVEPPPEPKAAATQTAQDDMPNAAEKTDLVPETAASPPPPPTPEVLTVPKAETFVPAPSDATQTPAPKTTTTETDDARSKKAVSQLAAALPTSSLSMPSTFRAMLSSQGTSASSQYKGAVFGSLGRATQAVSDEARRRHLRGQVVLTLVLDANGGLERVSVVQSSGSAEVDALAVDLARRAAPFPPPPPGTSRSFTPVITIGEDE